VFPPKFKIQMTEKDKSERFSVIFQGGYQQLPRECGAQDKLKSSYSYIFISL
jgi:hypothetical protein